MWAKTGLCLNICGSSAPLVDILRNETFISRAHKLPGVYSRISRSSLEFVAENDAMLRYKIPERWLNILQSLRAIDLLHS